LSLITLMTINIYIYIDFLERRTVIFVVL
jgi:hypothetical protein